MAHASKTRRLLSAALQVVLGTVLLVTGPVWWVFDLAYMVSYTTAHPFGYDPVPLTKPFAVIFAIVLIVGALLSV